jgi:benzodiazapine receptor
MSPTPLGSRRGATLALAAGASVVATSTAGRLITTPIVAGWYRTLVKPSFNPPNWAFPVAWSLLFVLMGVAFWRVLRTEPRTPGRSVAVVLFLAQLLLNVGWSAAFFGSQSPARGMLVIVPLWLLIVATALAFRRVERVAGWLFVPYIAWVAFAMVLNLAIWRLN